MVSVAHTGTDVFLASLNMPHLCPFIAGQGRIQVLRKGGSNIFDVAKYIGVLDVIIILIILIIILILI